MEQIKCPVSRAEAGHPFREPLALSFTWQNPKLHTQMQLSIGSKTLILKGWKPLSMSAGPASLSPGALAVSSRGRCSPDGEQLALKTACQMWPAGLAAGYPGQWSPIQSGQGLVPRTGTCLAGPGKYAEIISHLRSCLVLLPPLPWWGGVFITRE